VRVLPLVSCRGVVCLHKRPRRSLCEARRNPGPAAAAPQAGAIAPVPAQLPEVVARVNGDPIGKAEFEKASRPSRSERCAVPVDQRDRIYRGVLDQIISFRLLTQESKARKNRRPEAEVDARIAQIRGQFPSQEAFNPDTRPSRASRSNSSRPDARVGDAGFEDAPGGNRRQGLGEAHGGRRLLQGQPDTVPARRARPTPATS
jgi:hypothetical protein